MHVRRRTGRGRRVLLPAVGLAAVVLATATGSFANSPANPSGPPNIQGEAVRSRTSTTAVAEGAVGAAARPRQGRVRGPVQQVRGAGGHLGSRRDFLATGLWPSDDVAAARAYLSANRELLGLSEEALADLEVLNAPALGAGSAVLFRQRFDGLAAGRDGLATVGVVDGKVAFLSSSLTTDTSVTNSVIISPAGRRSRRGQGCRTAGRSDLDLSAARTTGRCWTSRATPIRLGPRPRRACRHPRTACAGPTRSR